MRLPAMTGLSTSNSGARRPLTRRLPSPSASRNLLLGTLRFKTVLWIELPSVDLMPPIETHEAGTRIGLRCQQETEGLEQLCFWRQYLEHRHLWTPGISGRFILLHAPPVPVKTMARAVVNCGPAETSKHLLDWHRNA